MKNLVGILIFCPNCGCELEGLDYCPNCGYGGLSIVNNGIMAQDYSKDDDGFESNNRFYDDDDDDYYSDDTDFYEADDSYSEDEY